jgi:hypothetical protein
VHDLRPECPRIRRERAEKGPPGREAAQFQVANSSGESNLTENPSQCLYCRRSSEQVPLLELAYQGKTIWICPQDLPILIHRPAEMEDWLPGASSFGPPAEHPHG